METKLRKKVSVNFDQWRYFVYKLCSYLGGKLIGLLGQLVSLN